MNITEIKESSAVERESRGRELNEEIFHLRLQQQSGQLENSSQLRILRREIARIHTVAVAASLSKQTLSK